uniref:PKD domain-containing protein n=1 Tax=uncultured Croceitalea sp. TaxID=1798908 RepID=UPI003305CC34
VTDGGGLMDTATIVITVDPANGAPDAVATSDVTGGEAPLTVSFTGDQSTDDVGIMSYSWDFGDGGTSKDSNPEYTFTEAGVFEVVLTVTDSDGLTDTATIEITVLENETQSQETGTIIVSPNPVESFANLYMSDLPESKIVMKFYVHDATGRLMNTFERSEVFVDEGHYQIPLFTLRDELYFITVEFNEGDPMVSRVLLKN